MKIHYKYFKQEEKQQQKKVAFQAYTKEMDKRCKASESEYEQQSTSWLIKTPFGYFRVGNGNTKVNFPTINLESGLSCTSQDTCPYSYGVKRKGKSNKPLCYAQKLEGSRPAMFNAKQYQAVVSERIAKKATAKQLKEIIDHVVKVTDFLASEKFVRFSEVGDIGETVRPFAIKLIKALVKAGMSPYLYTKTCGRHGAQLKRAGAVVIRSDEDFVCVQDEAEASKLKLPVCPGQCGGIDGCYRCPLGKKSAVLKH